MADEVREAESERDRECEAFSELLRLARRYVSPFEDGELSTYTQAEALRDLEDWLLRAQPSRRVLR
jgi:hypothetical protein